MKNLRSFERAGEHEILLLMKIAGMPEWDGGGDGGDCGGSGCGRHHHYSTDSTIFSPLREPPFMVVSGSGITFTVLVPMSICHYQSHSGPERAQLTRTFQSEKWKPPQHETNIEDGL